MRRKFRERLAWNYSHSSEFQELRIGIFTPHLSSYRVISENKKSSTEKMKCAHGEISISYISLMLFKVEENSSAFFSAVCNAT